MFEPILYYAIISSCLITLMSFTFKSFEFLYWAKDQNSALKSKGCQIIRSFKPYYNQALATSTFYLFDFEAANSYWMVCMH